MAGDVKIEVHELRPYFHALAAMVAADREVTPAEERQFVDFIKQHGVPDDVAAEVVARLHEPSDPTELVAQLRESPCRFSLYLDALAIAWSDEVVAPGEREMLADLRAALGITQDEADVLEEFFISARQVAQAGDAAGEDQKQRLKSAVAKAAAVGVPVAAVAASGTVGLSAAGIVSGLTALGFGMGLLPGIGTAVLIGFGSYKAVKWLMSKPKDA
jgi:hypothetical protein